MYRIYSNRIIGGRRKGIIDLSFFIGGLYTCVAHSKNIVKDYIALAICPVMYLFHMYMESKAEYVDTKNKAVLITGKLLAY